MVSQLELEVTPGATADEFAVRVIRAVAGGRPAGTMRLDTESLLAACVGLEDTVLASAVSARRTLSPGEERLRKVGQQLFDALFCGDVEEAYRSSSSVAVERSEKLRLVLRLSVPVLAGFPWEAMYDGKTDEYVCLKEPLVRHVEAPFTPEPLAVDPPLRVLGLVASPGSMAALDVAVERDRLMEALRGPVGAGRIEVEWLMQASWEAVHDKLLSDTWHVLHFIGHGDYDYNSDQGVIALVAPSGRAHLVEADRLADLLDQASPTPRLVVLNSCESGRGGGRDLFSSTAATLVKAGISAVAAMQFTVSDPGAIAFARGFYSALANGRTIDEAARSGRIGIRGTPGTLEWVTPVLYVRGDANQLFNLKRVRTQPSPRLQSLYAEGRALLEAQQYDGALQRFEDVFNLDPDYRDAAALRAKAAQLCSTAHPHAGVSVAPEQSARSTATTDGGTADHGADGSRGKRQQKQRPADQARPKRRWWRRKGVVIPAAVLAVIAVGVVIAFAWWPHPLFNGYTLQPTPIHVEPNLSSPIVGNLAADTSVYIACTRYGDWVRLGPSNTQLWDKVRTDPHGKDLGFVPDAYVHTGSGNPEGPAC
jgi:hypothetical protein